MWLGLVLAAVVPVKVAVLDIDASGVSQEVAASVGMLVPTELRTLAQGGASVISGDEVRAMLGFEAQRQALGCEGDSSCLSELVGALGVDELLTGKVGRLGSTFVLELRRLDMRTARAIGSATATVGGPEDALAGAMRALVGEVYRGAPFLAPARRGGVAIVAGAVAVLAAGAGLAYALTVDQAYRDQQPGGPAAQSPTVTRAQAALASRIYWSSIGVGGVGLAAATVGAVLRFAPRPAGAGGEVGFGLAGSF